MVFALIFYINLYYHFHVLAFPPYRSNISAPPYCLISEPLNHPQPHAHGIACETPNPEPSLEFQELDSIPASILSTILHTAISIRTWSTLIIIMYV